MQLKETEIMKFERYQNINLPDIENAEYLNVKVCFENHVMCNVELPMKKKNIF